LVCTRFNRSEEDLIKHCNKPEYSDPRRLCWWLLNRHARMTHQAIAHHFDCRERTTILHGIRYIDGLPRHSPLKEHREELDRLCRFLK
jgi:chromosomal replication initiation ATPase DnaA